MRSVTESHIERVFAQPRRTSAGPEIRRESPRAWQRTPQAPERKASQRCDVSHPAEACTRDCARARRRPDNQHFFERRRCRSGRPRSTPAKHRRSRWPPRHSARPVPRRSGPKRSRSASPRERRAVRAGWGHAHRPELALERAGEAAGHRHVASATQLRAPERGARRAPPRAAHGRRLRDRRQARAGPLDHKVRAKNTTLVGDRERAGPRQARRRAEGRREGRRRDDEDPQRRARALRRQVERGSTGTFKVRARARGNARGKRQRRQGRPGQRLPLGAASWYGPWLRNRTACGQTFTSGMLGVATQDAPVRHEAEAPPRLRGR